MTPPAAPRELGRTGIRVFPIGLGGMPLSVAGRPGEDRALEVIRASLDAGVEFIDTADVYCLDDADIGHNERLIADALSKLGRTGSVTVATKGGLRRPGGDWTSDARPESLIRACEASLRALDQEAVALYQLHAPDPAVPFEESVGALARLKEQGKILHAGLSNVSARQLDAAQKIVRIESVQNRANPFECEDYSGGMLDACEEQCVTYLPYSTVGGHRGHARVRDQTILGGLARKYGATPYQIILAWHLGKSARILPIPGASRVASASESPRAAGITLDPADASLVDALSA